MVLVLYMLVYGLSFCFQLPMHVKQTCYLRNQSNVHDVYNISIAEYIICVRYYNKKQPQ